MSMKIDEVMLGDIVSVSGRPIHVTLAILNHWSDNIEPVPLTPEILEKNGFEWIKNKIVDEAYVLTKTFWDEEPELIIRRFDFNESFVICTSWDDTSFMSIGYVHELQHLLKLCGIEKEIVV